VGDGSQFKELNVNAFFTFTLKPVAYSLVKINAYASDCDISNTTSVGYRVPYGVGSYQRHIEYAAGNTILGKLNVCERGSVDARFKLACIADTQPDAHEPPGPEAAVVQSAIGAVMGIVSEPRRPDTSKRMLLGLKG